MLVTGNPFSEVGMEIDPVVLVGTAVVNPLPRDAFPFETVKVHLMPSTVQVSANALVAERKTNANRIA